ncbi:hypothetical protein BH10CYA1_BH10CYA1_39650 [soil metagenome]
MQPFLKVTSPSVVKLVAHSLLAVPTLAFSMLCVSIIVVLMQSARAEQKSPPSNKKQHMTNQKKNVSVEVTKTLEAQAQAWNAGDLDKFMSSYLKSPDITFVSADGEMKGYDALESRYRKKYGTSRDTMGKLSFSELEIQSLGEENALCIGHWLVERTGRPSLQGIFSLVLTVDAGGWKIIHDHTSLSQTPGSK